MASTKAMRTQLRPVLLRVHPDKYPDHPEARDRNTESLQRLNNYLDNAASGKYAHIGSSGYEETFLTFLVHRTATSKAHRMIRNQLVFSRVFPLQATDPATPLEKITVTLPAVYDLSPLLEAFDLAPERTERKRSPQFQVPAYETEHAAGLAAWLREELANAVSKRDASGQ
eukprot:3996040-Pyramimonas_sp.AAC.1